ncbi:hypothetical protein [Oscillatoria sp. FACHB-1406]|uniref:hypothetical protein n=1 Tax=Oscillatoria sp. FACHB-1406 TaxID=2692846 RepID=UPI0018EF9886|nr:hypothetical protein [Oscillatoria sp. FACHB-1406]
MRKVLIFDTCVLCVLLKIPNMEECGKVPNDWNFIKLEEKLKQEESQETVFVLPLAAIIETGNHISQASSKRRELAEKFN